MNKPAVSIHSSEANATEMKRCYMIQIHLHGARQQSFRLAVLSPEEKTKLNEAMRRLQIGSAPRLRAFYILPQPPIFDDVDKLIADIAAARHERGYEPQ